MKRQWVWVRMPGDDIFHRVYLRSDNSITTWGYDEQDDPEVLPAGSIILPGNYARRIMENTPIDQQSNEEAIEEIDRNIYLMEIVLSAELSEKQREAAQEVYDWLFDMKCYL